MRLREGERAPLLRDVNGRALDLRGEVTLLVFLRHLG